jgi:hypothetical protein
MLKKASGKIEVLTIDGSEIHAVRPNKAVWDDYTDELFERGEDGELRAKSGRAISTLYSNCVKKLANVIVGVDEAGKDVLGTLTNTDDIVAFLKALESADAGRKIDAWLLGLGDLIGPELKN